MNLNTVGYIQASPLSTATVIRSSLLFRLVACALLCVGLVAQSRASLNGAQPSITIEVVSPLGFPAYRAAPFQLPYTFNATLTLPAGGPQIEGDLYFGIISPGGTAYSWVHDGADATLKKGLIPFTTGFDLAGEATINASDLLTGSIGYTVAGTEELGMYLVFALVVAADTDPGDTAGWMGIEMRPLFVDP